MTTRNLALLNFGLATAMLIASAWAWTLSPGVDAVAVHWNLKGDPVAFRSKEVVLLAAPVLALLIGVVGVFANSRLARAAMVSGGLALASLHVFFVLAVVGYVETFGNYTALFPGVFIAVMGNFMTKAVGGVRAPLLWAPSEPERRERAQRWLGRLFVVSGLATIVSWFLFPGPISELVLIGTALSSLILAPILSMRAPRNGNQPSNA
jgi:hypothetical protein